MKKFFFDGVIPSSKSHFNRALICASYASQNAEVNLQGFSRCDDVEKMQLAFSRLQNNSVYDCGSAGTVLRFLALRASRIAGLHILKGHPRLMSRPQEDLREIFEQMSVKMQLYSDRLLIQSSGWKLKNNTLKVNREKSSQFISGVLLNAWDLDFPLNLEWEQDGVSEGYWQMSLQVVQDFGMTVQQKNSGLVIPAHSKVNLKNYTVESDISSAFAIAAYAALNGEARFQQFPFKTLQPDVVFLQILEKMGLTIEKTTDTVHLLPKKENQSLRGVHCNLNNSPDLFPVLATLCAFAKGPSRLDGAPHLIFKESNRIQKTAELLQHMGVSTKILSDGMEIHPPEQLVLPKNIFTYDPDHDHRLAFAAALLKSQNYPIQILHPEVVNKSFPEFWDILVNSSKNL